MKIGIVFSTLFTAIHVNAMCRYSTYYPKQLDQQTAEQSIDSLPFAVIVRDGTTFDSIDSCVSFCQSKKWCIATADLSGYSETVGAYCQFITSVYTLLDFEHKVTYNEKGDLRDVCDGAFNTQSCDLFKYNVSMLINIDNNVLQPLTVGMHGSNYSELVLPSSIVGEEENDDIVKFCRIVKADTDIVGTDDKVYSDFYTTSNIVYKAWVDNESTDKINTKTAYNTNGRTRRGTSLPYRGQPITGMKLETISPVEGAYDFQRYVTFQHEFMDTIECATAPEDDSKLYVSQEELDNGDTYFYIKAHVGDVPKYFSCTVSDGDSDKTCRWSETPVHAWKMASFVKRDIFRYVDYIRNGFNATFIAYDISNSQSNEIGWLDRGHCDTDAAFKYDEIKLLAGGKKSGSSDIHCGVGAWRLSRGLSNKLVLTDYSIHMQQDGLGSWLSILSDLMSNTEFAAGSVGGYWDGDVSGYVGNLCGFQVFTWSNANSCPTTKSPRAGDIELISVPLDHTNGNLFRLGSNGLFMHCDYLGDSKCRWKNDSPYVQKQYFKFVNNGIDNSKTNPQDDKLENGNAAFQILVYETDMGFVRFVGYLAMLDSSDGLKFNVGVTTDSLVDSTRYFKEENNKIKTSLQSGDFYITQGTVGEVVTSVISTSSVNVPGMIAIGAAAILDDSKFHWINSPEKINSMDTCPEGEYLHQVRCKENQQCTTTDIACVKPKNSCKVNTTSPLNVKELKERQWVNCAYGEVIVGRNNSHFVCQKLDIIKHTPVNHTKRESPKFGTFSIKKTSVTERTINVRQAEWINIIYRDGSPMQALDNSYTPWRYGEMCFAEFDTFKAAKLHIVNRKGVLSKCEKENEYVTFISCVEKGQCQKGFNFTCHSVNSCITGGDTYESTTTCPYGSVIVGLECTGDHEVSPCSTFKVQCKTISFDPSYTPPSPSPSPSPSNDNGNIVNKDATKIILGLAIGIPLLIILGLVCLCCVPDEAILNDTHEAAHQYTAVSTESQFINDDYDGVDRYNLRKRHGRKPMNVF